MCILYTEVLQPIGANIKKPGSGVAETGPSLRERVSPFSCEFLQNVHLAARKRNETKNAKEKAKMHCSFHKICQSPEKHTKIYQVTFWKEKEKEKNSHARWWMVAFFLVSSPWFGSIAIPTLAQLKLCNHLGELYLN